MIRKIISYKCHCCKKFFTNKLEFGLFCSEVCAILSSKNKKYKNKIKFKKNKSHSFHVMPCKNIVKNDKFYRSVEWRNLRYAAFEKYGNKCQCCRKEYGPMHVDHIKPRSRYPQYELKISNLQILCEECNLGKMAKYDTDWRIDSVSKRFLINA